MGVTFIYLFAYLYVYFNVYLFILRERERERERKRERENMWAGGGAEREESQNPKQAMHCQGGAWSHEPWDHDLSQNQESYAYPLSHLGTFLGVTFNTQFSLTFISWKDYYFFIESPLHLCWNQLTMYMWVYFWTLHSCIDLCVYTFPINWDQTPNDFSLMVILWSVCFFINWALRQ